MTSREMQKAHWDKLYQRDEYAYGTSPNRYLLKQAFRLKPGTKALAVGDGEGRNGIWLATQGLDVVSVDWSHRGAEKGKHLASQQNVALSFECCDLMNWSWPKTAFDVVTAIYLHLIDEERRFVHASIVGCLKPAGLLVVEAFHRRHGTGDGTNRTADTFYTAQLMRQDFRTLEFIELLEETAVLDEGYMHQGSAEIVRLLARKPDDLSPENNRQ